MLDNVIFMADEKKKRRGRPPNQTILRDWVSTKWPGDHKALADQLGIKITYLEKILSGSLQMSHDLAYEIEELTRGEITHGMLRPRKAS